MIVIVSFLKLNLSEFILFETVNFLPRNLSKLRKSYLECLNVCLNSFVVIFSISDHLDSYGKVYTEIPRLLLKNLNQHFKLLARMCKGL